MWARKSTPRAAIIDSQSVRGAKTVPTRSLDGTTAKRSVAANATSPSTRIERPGRQPLVARFGGQSLRRQKTAKVIDSQPIRVDYPH